MTPAEIEKPSGALITLPLTVTLARKRTVDKRISLNLNVYRNAHYHVLDDAKKTLKKIITEELTAETEKIIRGMKPPYCFTYVLYPGTKRLTDLGNVLSIVQKFCDDALVELGLLEDDNYLVLRRVIYDFGEVDRENPRVELIINELEGTEQSAQKG